MPEASCSSRTVGIDGLNFHFCDWGGAGPSVVMLHGLSGHARTWDHTAAALSEEYHVLALDQRGHGDSDWAPEYGLRPMAQDLLGFLDARNLGAVTLMGLSMGGLVSIVFAAANPDRVSRMVIMDIGPEIARAGSANVARSLAATDIFSSEDEAFAQARAANPRPTDATLRHRVRHALRPLPDGTLTYKYDKQLRGSARAWLDHTPAELWAAWRALTCPVLLVRGADSDILAADTAERMLAENPNVSFASIPDCGHSITLDRPDALLEVLGPWLAATAGGQAA